VCERCGVATTYPAPTDAELAAAYASWYRPQSGRFAGGGDRVLAISRATLARRIDRVTPAGPLLDVGCGDGALLRALRARGREAVGLERTANPGEGIIARDITDFDERAGEWAGAIFWHSLEHLAEPAAAIDRAVALLAPGGVLAVAVPNRDSWQARAFADHWFHLDLPRHLVHLPASALVDGLTARGLTVTRVSHWRAGQIVFGWLQGIVGLAPGRPDLYSAIRRPEAQDTPTAGRRRAAVLATAATLTPLAAALSAAEIAARAGGTVYVEARR
jgi:SAM-dependent methyltransferase